MLWVLAVPLAVGCHQMAMGPPAPPAIVSPTPNDTALRAAVREEIGPAAEKAMPPVARTPRQPADPGAEALLRSMLSSLDDSARDPAGRTRIGLSRLRNQSHCSPREFEALRQRLADLLTRAGRSQQITFLADAEPPLDYELRGTAYLITADGFDQWELYLSLSPMGETWTIWQAQRPVRLLRQLRAGDAQVLFAP